MLPTLQQATKAAFCCMGILAVLSCESKPSVEDLRAQLKSPDQAVRDGAAERLVGEGDRAGFEYFMALARGNDVDRRHYAVAWLGRCGNTEAVPLLISMFENADTSLAQTLTLSLGQLPDKRAVETLIKALTQGDFSLRMHASNALAQIGDLAVAPLIAEWDRPGHHTLHGPAKVVETLGQMKNPKALRVLIEALGYGELRTRKAAIEALTNFGAAAEPALKEALSSEKEVVRVNAQAVLDKM